MQGVNMTKPRVIQPTVGKPKIEHFFPPTAKAKTAANAAVKLQTTVFTECRVECVI